MWSLQVKTEGDVAQWIIAIAIIRADVNVQIIVRNGNVGILRIMRTIEDTQESWREVADPYTTQQPHPLDRSPYPGIVGKTVICDSSTKVSSRSVEALCNCPEKKKIWKGGNNRTDESRTWWNIQYAFPSALIPPLHKALRYSDTLYMIPRPL